MKLLSAPSISRLMPSLAGGSHRHAAAFTMVEIAISLAVIGFAFVAIIGVLPIGMRVQKENREETIINQDAAYFLDAIRNGARGLDDLTNYVFAITNYVQKYDAATNPVGNTVTNGYTFAISTRDGVPDIPKNQFPIVNGYRIVGLLGTPKYQPVGAGFFSNHVVACVRAMSGSAAEIFPQMDATVLENTFSYRLVPEVSPRIDYDRDWTNFTAYTWGTDDYNRRSNYWRLVLNREQNLHELRLTFRWPLLPNGNIGNGRQIFRTLAGGQLLLLRATNECQCPTLYFFQPQTFVKAP